MKLSVLITFYNQERFVDQALSSVLAQRVGFGWEILVGDDGSTDGTVAKLEAWRKKYPGLIQYFVRDREPDPPGFSNCCQGRDRVSANRLDLLERAQGDFFLILDGDDFFTNELKLRKQVEILDDPANADCSACAHNTNLYWEATGAGEIMHNPGMMAQKFIPERYIAVMYFHPSALMFRNVFQGQRPDIFRRLHFDDQHITFYMLNYGGIYYLPENMASYRQHPDSIWTSIRQAEKNIMNFAIKDTGVQLNPQYRAAHSYRALPFQSWLYQHRLELGSSAYDCYRIYAERVGASSTLDWLNYRGNGPAARVGALWGYQKDLLAAKYFKIAHTDYFKPGGGRN